MQALTLSEIKQYIFNKISEIMELETAYYKNI